MRNNLDTIFKIIADAGYESEENYVYLERQKRSCIKNSMISQGLIKARKKWIVIPANVGIYPFFTPKFKELRSLTKN